MKTINLVYIEKSDIKYKISKFPDGQQQVTIQTIYGKTTIIGWNEESFQIKSRLNNFQDLELIICTVKSLKELGVKKIHLYTPYFLGSRSDRQFEKGSNNYLKDVICPIINSLNFESVTVLDPHSDVLEACLNNFKKVDNKKLVEFGLSQIYYNEPYKDISIRNNFKDFILISPDAGANKKIFKLAEQIGYEGEIITCSKSRDENGKLTQTFIPFDYHDNIEDKDLIIIDDICDGGATFINIAKKFKDSGYNNKIYLIVTHGIFSKGFEELEKYFDGVYCTNSYQDLKFDNNSIGNKYSKLVKQLNVF